MPYQLFKNKTWKGRPSFTEPCVALINIFVAVRICLMLHITVAARLEVCCKIIPHVQLHMDLIGRKK